MDHELLAIKLALKKWCHWLDAAACPFTINIHHKSLEYLKAAQRLNPCQLCWTLFFTHFNNAPRTLKQTLCHDGAPSNKPSPVPEPFFRPPISLTHWPGSLISMTELVFEHMFRDFSLPKHIVSDQDAQLTSRWSPKAWPRATIPKLMGQVEWANWVSKPSGPSSFPGLNTSWTLCDTCQPSYPLSAHPWVTAASFHPFVCSTETLKTAQNWFSLAVKTSVLLPSECLIFLC